MSMVRELAGGWRVLVIGLLVLLLGACGSEEESTPDLAAPPTRTPAPATPTPEPDDVLAQVDIISLREGVAQFLDESEAASPLDRPVLFNQYVFDPHPECFSGAFFGTEEPLELMSFNLVSLNLARWRESLDAFPEADLIAAFEDTLTRAAEFIPVDQPLVVCTFPTPAFGAPHEMFNSGFWAETLSSGLVLAGCGGGDACLPYAGPQLAYAYHYAEQLAHADVAFNTMTLLELALFNARASDFARMLYPDAAFPWDIALDPALEADEWNRMRDFLTVTYQQYPEYRKIDLFLFGKGSDLYPDWGGMVIGTHIIDAFHENHPLVSYAELARMPAADVLEQSGYAPG